MIDTVEDGEKGSYLALINTHDVIVFDLNLQGKDGLKILHEIQERVKLKGGLFFRHVLKYQIKY